MKKHKPASQVVPENIEGKSVDLEETFIATNEDEANQVYKTASERLLDPSGWHELAGVLSGKFKPEKNGELKEKDFLMIDLPAPKNEAGEGHDWVQVEKLAINKEPAADQSIAMTLRASPNPHQPEEGVAHFFDQTATSSFILKKNGNKISASYYGRNEKPNTKEVGLTDKLRNSVVATGAMAGLSELQWRAVLKGLLKGSQ